MHETFNDLNNRFPNVKLSYETIIHKKVLNSQFICLIPKGAKCFIWFTYFKNKPSCFIVETKNNKHYFTITNCCFDKQLCYNTLCYGTLLKINNRLFFTIEDIFYYKGNNISSYNWYKKLHTLKNILEKEINDVYYNDKFLHLGLPIICKNVNEVSKYLTTQPYTIESLQFKLFNKISSYLVLKSEKFTSSLEKKNILSNVVFSIKPDIQNDMYKLFYLNKDKLEFFDNAYIPSYEKSVIMNNLFRKIKENGKLDRLEESDDEEEFQDCSIDKFVDLNKTVNMICKYHSKFKKWIPISTTDEQPIQKENFAIA